MSTQDGAFRLILHIARSMVEVFRIIFLTLTLGFYHGLIALVPNRYYPKKSIRKHVVVITGGGSGLGRMLALYMAKKGARVVLWDVDRPSVNKTADLIKKTEPEFEPKAYVCDISDKNQVYSVARSVVEEVGDVDILVNNAGIVTGKPLLECPDEKILKTMQVNCLSHFWTVKAFLPRMIERNSGHIVTISSGAGLISVNGLADYCASKYGAVGFHESLSLELSAMGMHNINTTLVCPYYINTGMFDGVTTKFPMTLPIMDPAYAAEKILGAILMNQKMIVVPRILYLFIFLKGILPVSVGHYLAHSMEVTKSMNEFKGRQNKSD